MTHAPRADHILFGFNGVMDPAYSQRGFHLYTTVPSFTSASDSNDADRMRVLIGTKSRFIGRGLCLKAVHA